MTQQLALLLSDIVGSTALNTAIGDAAMNRLWERHDRLARGLMRNWRGREIGRSDGFLLAFDTVEDATGFATSYHQALDRFEVTIRARVGIHVGAVELRRNAPEDTAAGATVYDIDGVAVPLAARISAAARGRQTLLSAAARMQLRETSHPVKSHGYWQFKGLADPIEVFEVGDELSDFAPPEDGEKAYQVVRDRDAWSPAREIRNSIPSAHDAFVGRGAELRRLGDLIASGARLVSVVGIGGVGKTRVVTHFAKRWLGEFPGGAWFCDLTQASDIDGIVYAVAQGLDVALGRTDPRRQLMEIIRGRGRCLIVLDNFEQVVSLASESVGHWLDRASDATFLTTSRERLQLPGEHTVLLEPLPVKDAVDMFVCRSHAQHPTLTFEPIESAAIEELVALLDGLPLAIELAVGRLGVMSPRTMLRRVGQRFKLLTTQRGRLKRQSTLRATFDWSWDLLTGGERSLLAQASVFVGGFTLEMAESVLRLADSEIAVLDTLQSLLDKSFVRKDGLRFNLLVSVRDYAAEKLASLPDDGVEAGAERRHGLYFAKAVAGDAKTQARELDNILAALRRAIARDDAAVAAPAAANAWAILEVRGPYQIGIELLEYALSAVTLSNADRAALTFILGRCLLVSGDRVRARDHLERSLQLASAEESRLDQYRSLAGLAELNLIEGNIDEAKAQYEEAVRGAESLGHPAFQCAALNGMGLYFNRIGRAAEARSMFERALRVARETGKRRWEGGVLSNLGGVELRLGNRAEARRYYDAAIEVAREVGDRVWEGDFLCNLGLLKLESGDLANASSDFEASLRLAAENGLSHLESVVLCNIGLLHERGGDVRRAEDAYVRAVDVAKRRGDRRSEGQFLGYLGLLIAQRGDMAKGRDCLLQSISILRDVRDRMSLAIALCRHAEGCILWNERTTAAASIDEAASIAAAIEVGQESELADSLARARSALSHAHS